MNAGIWTWWLSLPFSNIRPPLNVAWWYHTLTNCSCSFTHAIASTNKVMTFAKKISPAHFRDIKCSLPPSIEADEHPYVFPRNQINYEVDPELLPVLDGDCWRVNWHNSSEEIWRSVVHWLQGPWLRSTDMNIVGQV